MISDKSIVEKVVCGQSTRRKPRSSSMMYSIAESSLKSFSSAGKSLKSIDEELSVDSAENNLNRLINLISEIKFEKNHEIKNNLCETFLKDGNYKTLSVSLHGDFC